MNIWCTLVGHRRSRSNARLNPDTALYESRCRHCRAPMIRLERGKWLVRDEILQAEQKVLQLTQISAAELTKRLA